MLAKTIPNVTPEAEDQSDSDPDFKQQWMWSIIYDDYKHSPNLNILILWLMLCLSSTHVTCSSNGLSALCPLLFRTCSSSASLYSPFPNRLLTDLVKETDDSPQEDITPDYLTILSHNGVPPHLLWLKRGCICTSCETSLWKKDWWKMHTSSSATYIDALSKYKYLTTERALWAKNTIFPGSDFTFPLHTQAGLSPACKFLFDWHTRAPSMVASDSL
jgi:hypothetical protein